MIRLLRPIVLALVLVAALPVAASAETDTRVLLTQLDSEAAVARRRAVRRLEKAGDVTEADLRAALAQAGERGRPLLLALGGRMGLSGLTDLAIPLITSQDPATADAAGRALALFGEEAVRKGLSSLASRQDDPAAGRAADRLRALRAQLVVERAVLSKWRRKGGSYRGRYVHLAKLGWEVQPILLCMLLDVPLEDRFLVLPDVDEPEIRKLFRNRALTWVYTSSRRGYTTFEPLPARISEEDLFELAVQSMRDVADADLVGPLLEMVVHDLDRANRRAGWRLRPFEEYYAESIAGVLHARGRPAKMQNRLRQIRGGVSRARQNLRMAPRADRPDATQTYVWHLKRLGAVQHLMEQYKDAVRTYEEVISLSVQLTGAAPAIDSYNRACALALSGRKEEAMAQLDTALGLGVDDLTREWVAEDGDLHSLHDDPRFRKILDKHFGRRPPPK